jgi:hypothetical protein
LNSTQQLEQQFRLRDVTRRALQKYRPLLRERTEEPSRDLHSSIELELLGGRSFLYSVSGVIDSAKIRSMYIAMYRVSRGNLIMSAPAITAGLGYFTVWYQTALLGRKLLQIG